MMIQHVKTEINIRKGCTTTILPRNMQPTKSVNKHNKGDPVASKAIVKSRIANHLKKPKYNIVTRKAYEELIRCPKAYLYPGLGAKRSLL